MPDKSSSAPSDALFARSGLRIIRAMQPSAAHGKTCECVAEQASAHPPARPLLARECVSPIQEGGAYATPRHFAALPRPGSPPSLWRTRGGRPRARRHPLSFWRVHAAANVVAGCVPRAAVSSRRGTGLRDCPCFVKATLATRSWSSFKGVVGVRSNPASAGASVFVEPPTAIRLSVRLRLATHHRLGRQC
jgi:hypothetical protein